MEPGITVNLGGPGVLGLCPSGLHPWGPASTASIEENHSGTVCVCVGGGDRKKVPTGVPCLPRAARQGEGSEGEWSGHLPWRSGWAAWAEEGYSLWLPLLLSLALASETFIQGLQLPGSHITPLLPPILFCPSEVPDGLVQGSQARFTPCSILPTSGPWGARRRAWQGGRWWVGRRGCPADGRLSGQMANWVGVRSSPICFCPCRGFSQYLQQS